MFLKLTKVNKRIAKAATDTKESSAMIAESNNIVFVFVLWLPVFNSIVFL